MKRIASIDALRGLAIFGMVFCATIGWNSNLPAWMFHCQVPPPDYVFNPDVRGITWVDLVFPFFLFSMGAAFPFSLTRRLEKGDSTPKLLLGILRRWVILVIFALVLGNYALIGGTGCPEIWQGVFYIAVWAALFASLLRTPRRWVNYAGYAVLAALFAVEGIVCGARLNVHSNDIIIMILSSVALFGSLIWLLTRSSRRLRWLVFAAVVAVKAVTSYTDVLDCLALPSWIDWLFNWGFLQYLVIALPASVVGDMLLGKAPETVETGFRASVPSLIAGVAILLQLWALFTREVFNDFLWTGTAMLGYVLLTFRNIHTHNRIAYIGWALLLVGILFDPIDGGIAKDHCNLSYLFVTGGMAALTVSIFLDIEAHTGKAGWMLPMLGQNPMIAYTVTSFVIGPVLYVTGLMGLLDGLSAGSPFWGIIHGIVLTGLMCLATCLFTKHKIYWRS